MKSADMHLEHLFDRQRRGRLSAAEQADLSGHLAACESCRWQRARSADFAVEMPAGSDAALLERAIGGALVTHAARVQQRAQLKRAGAGLAAVCALGAALAAASGTQQKKRSAAVDAAPAVAIAPGSSVTPSWAAPTSAPAAPGAAASATIEAAPTSALPPAAEAQSQRPTAEQLYAQANASRRSGALADALRTYQRLTREYPRSRQAITSHVAVGTLLSDRGEDARQALQHFDMYLWAQPQGNLAEEALHGRVSSLARLGRSAEAEVARQELLSRFPHSVYGAGSR